MEMTRARGSTPAWVAFAYAAGFALIFLGERVITSVEWLHWLLTSIGTMAVVSLTVARWIAVSRVTGERRRVERSLAILSTCGVCAIALYFTTTEVVEQAIGIGRMPLASRFRYEGAATVVWVALVICALVPMLFAEYALFPMRGSTGVEWRRVRQALVAGLTLALAATYGALFTFTTGQLDLKADFSYFHTARPSESTRKIAASARDPIQVLAFFPQVNPVGTEVGAYLRDLARGIPVVQVREEDRLLVPDVAKQAKVFEDGVIVIERGPERESISLGVDIAAARPKLKGLDAEFQKALLKVLRERRTAYFTVGHGELNDTQPTAQNDGRTGRVIRQILEQQNYLVRDLSSATGLAVEVPEDASLVLVLGPQQPFLPEETAALGRYAARGGRLFLCLDPEARTAIAPLAEIVGLTVSSSVLANDKVHLRRRFNDSDHAILVTNRYSSHASVSTLSRFSSRPVIFVGAGALDKKPGADSALRVDFTVRSLPDTFADDNGNFLFDAAAEKRQAYALAAAVSKPTGATPQPGASPSGAKPSEEMRAFVLADADAVSDAVLGNEANVLLVADAVRWMGGEESFAGMISTPEDVRIEHTKQKDLVWFYGTIFGAPAIVVGSGLFYTRRLRRPKREGAPAAHPDRQADRVDKTRGSESTA